MEVDVGWVWNSLMEMMWNTMMDFFVCLVGMGLEWDVMRDGIMENGRDGMEMESKIQT